MKLKNVWPENKVWAFLKVSYILGGDLSLASDLSGYSISFITKQAYSVNWARGVPLGGSVKGVNHTFRSTKHALTLAKRLNLAGISKKKIGKCFGVSESFIGLVSKEQNWVASDKCKGQRLFRSLTRVQLEDILAKYSNGYSITELSNTYGFLSRGPVKKLVVAAGIHRAKEWEFTETQVMSIIDTYTSGVGTHRIAKKLGCDSSAVCRILRENSVELRGSLEANREIARKNWEIKLINRREGARTLGHDIRRLTSAVYSLYSDAINPEQLPRSKYLYHLDHIYSVTAALNNYGGLRHPPNIWEICHPANLQMLTATENLRKSGRRDFTTSQLRVAISKWNNDYMDPYFINGHQIFDYIRNIYGKYDSFGELGCASWRRYYKTSDRAQC